MPEVQYNLVKIGNRGWKPAREEAEVLLQALLSYASEDNRLAKHEKRLKEIVKLSPEKWLPGNKLSIQRTTLENLAELTEFARQEEICRKSLDQTREDKKKRQVARALECLKGLGIREGGSIDGSKFWEFTLHLKSQDTTDNLKWLFKPGGEWDRRYKEWKRLYPNREDEEKSETLQPELSPASSPYRGLFAFGVDDEQFFFGRENFTEKLVKAVQSKPAIAVIGSSGSGKSSVVFAGLIPKLGKDWCVVTFRPGDRPFHALAAKLVHWLYPDPLEQVSNGKKLAEKFRQGDAELQDIAEFILRNHSDVRRLLLVVDQFEELYTLCPEEEERKRFLDVLLAPVAAEAYSTQLNFTVVITLRADFCGQAYSDPQFTNAFQGDAHQILGSMNGLEKRRAIEEPARLLGVELQEGLTQRILDDVGEKPGNLPLLEFALDLLWKKQNDRTLTHAAYDEIGGVRKALAKHADAVYEQLSKEDRKRAQQIFTQLVCPGEGTEDTRRLATPDDVGKKNWDLVTRLANEKVRLVVTGQDELTGKETVEIIHEALIKEWERLREWIEDAREFRTWQERLRFRIAQWKASAKDKGDLLKGATLVEAEKWLEEQCDRIPADEQAFIQASRECQEQEEQRERELRRQAEISEIEALSSLSQARFLLHDQLGALLAAVKAGKKLQHTKVPSNIKILTLTRLHQAVYGVQELNRLQRHSASVTSVSCSPTDQLLASASEDGTVSLWRFDGTLLTRWKNGDGSCKVLDVSFSPDGQMVASASLWGVRVYRLNGTQLKYFEDARSNEYFQTVSFSPDGETLASTDGKEIVNLWRLNSTVLQSFPVQKALDVSFSPDGQLLACAMRDGTLELKNLNGITQKTFKWKSSRKDSGIARVSFSSDGKWLATVDGKTVLLWSLDSTKPQNFNKHTNEVNSVIFSPDGQMLASGSSDGTIKLWKVLDSTELRTFQGHSGDVNKLSFSPNGEILASAGQDGTVRIWRLKHQDLPTFQGCSRNVRTISFSPDGQMLASGSDDGIVRLWNIKSNELKTFPADTASFQRITAHRIDAWIIVQEDTQSADNVNVCPIVGIGFSPKNQALISAFNNGTVHIRSLNDNELNIFKGFDVINAMSLSPNGEILALSEEENSIRLWNIDGTLLKPLKLSSPITVAISAITYSPNGEMLAVACDWGKIVLLSLMEGNELYTFQAHTDEIINSISFSPDSKMLASASRDGTVKLWSIASNQSKTFHGHSSKVTNVSFSPDGQILASSSWDKTVKLWNLDGSELHTFQGHTTPVNVVAFSPHGQMLASASRDGKVILWNLQLDELLVHGCNWLRDYLKTNPNVSESDRHLCDGIGTQK